MSYLFWRPRDSQAVADSLFLDLLKVFARASGAKLNESDPALR